MPELSVLSVAGEGGVELGFGPGYRRYGAERDRPFCGELLRRLGYPVPGIEVTGRDVEVADVTCNRRRPPTPEPCGEPLWPAWPGRRSSRDVEELGGHERFCVVVRGAVGTADPPHTASTRAASFGSGRPRILKAKRRPEQRGVWPWCPPWRRLRPRTRDRRRLTSQRIEALLGTPRTPLGPVRSVALERVGSPRSGHVGHGLAA
jgi:hypothetical protein